MLELLETLFVVLLLVGMAFFTYMSVHMVEERKKGKTILLPWEKGYKLKCFDKSDVKYRDGDNT